MDTTKANTAYQPKAEDFRKAKGMTKRAANKAAKIINGWNKRHNGPCNPGVMFIHMSNAFTRRDWLAGRS